MKFIVDECVGPAIARWLKTNGHEVIFFEGPLAGIDDDMVLEICSKEKGILITSDKGFGEKVFLKQKKHYGIILLRLNHIKSIDKIAFLQKILDDHAHEIEGNFFVATESSIRLVKF